MSETTKLVFARERSDSAKLGPVSATYAAQQSCPTTCPFLGAGCYAENGFTSMVTTKRLNRAAQDRSPLAIAREEAVAIDGLTGERDLRLHVVGDSTTIEGTRLIAAAAARYIARHGKRVWTYCPDHGLQLFTLVVVKPISNWRRSRGVASTNWTCPQCGSLGKLPEWAIPEKR